ncbi:hypothetical protein RP20_CCG015063 [Aedes albopictus]|nr:hypothetical protein RP20_CCG015063 [Aedes albopictus]
MNKSTSQKFQQIFEKFNQERYKFNARSNRKMFFPSKIRNCFPEGLSPTLRQVWAIINLESR